MTADQSRPVSRVSVVEALTQIRALCDEADRLGDPRRRALTTGQVRAVLDAVSVDATPAQGIRAALVMLIDGWGAEQPLHLADAVLALVRPVEGIVLSPEEAAFVSKGLRHSQWWVQEDVDRAYAIASRLEVS